jgi:hypothetical protein
VHGCPHIVNGGPFALDTAADEMADHIRNFLSGR